MRTLAITLLLAAAGAAFAETPAPKVEPKQAPLSELQQTQIELIEARLQLSKANEQRLNEAAQRIMASACEALGGKTVDDCFYAPPSQAQPRYTVTLKPPKEAKK